MDSPVMFNVMCYFDNTKEITSFQLHFSKENAKVLTETKLVKNIFRSLSSKQIKHLMTAYVTQDTSYLMPLEFIKITNGSYHFNVSENHDPDTRYWAMFKEDHINSRSCCSLFKI